MPNWRVTTKPPNPWCLRAVMREGDVAFINTGSVNRYRLLERVRSFLLPWCRVSSVVLAVLLILGIVLQPKQWYPFFVVLPLASFCVAVGVFGALMLFWYRRRLARRVVETRARMCLGCGYDLSRRDKSNVVCAECGAVVSTRQCVIHWCKLYRSARAPFRSGGASWS